MPILRKLFYALIIVLTLLVGATSAVVIVTQTAWFKDWLRGYIVRQANQYINGQVSIERLGGNLFFGIELEKVGISLDGQDLVAIKDLGLKYNVFQLVSAGLSIDEIRLNHPVIYLRRDADTWSLAKLVKPQAQEADREGPTSPMNINAIIITDGSIAVDGIDAASVNVPKRVEHLDAQLSFKYEPVRYSIEVARLSLRTAEPAIQLNALSGGVSVRDDEIFLDKVALKTEETSLSVSGAVRQYLTTPIFNLELTSDKVSLPEIAHLVPALEGVALQPAFALKLDGALDRLGVTMDVRSSAGQASGRFLADVMSPGQSVQGEVAIQQLNLAGILPTQPKTDLTGTVKADLHGKTLFDFNQLTGDVAIHSSSLRGAGYVVDRVDLDAKIDGRAVTLNARAQAYGVGATAAGRVLLPESSEPIDYALHGDLTHINLRRLPRGLALPAAATDIGVGYWVRGREAMSGGDETPLTPADRTRRRSVVAELKFDESALAGARIAKGSLVRATIQGDDLTYEADATVAGLDLQRAGRDFGVSALTEARFQSLINGHVAAQGRGTSLKDLDLRASGELDESSVLGGQIPVLTFTASVADDSAHLIAHGYFSDFDPAPIGGNDALKGQIAGTADIDATISNLSAGFTVDAIAGDLSLSLEPSKVGDLVIDRAVVDVTYRDRSAEIRQLEIAGLDLSIQAQGTLALNDTGESHLTFKADTPRLQEIGALAGVALEGIARVDGTLTGNRTEFHAEGTLVGNGLEYENNGALSVTTKFSARIPELAWERAAVDGETSATFVTVAGQNINELQATTTFADRQLTFDMTARQPDRALSMAGALTLQPDRQELKLQRLGLESSGVRLQLAPDSTAVVRYGGGNTINVDNFKLTSGDAQISIDGAFGAPGAELEIEATNVDLATVDALLLREPQLSGRFEATTTVTGTKDDPRAAGTFAVSNGAFRQFHYDSLRGTFDYAQPGVNLDARLQQNASQWLSAKGYLPAALFKGAGTGGDQPAPTVAADSAGDRIDFSVDSSPIDLGLIQGFTTALTDVKGLAEAHLRVTGTAADPKPEGTLTVANGSMKVEPTGGVYSHMVARLELQPDRIHIAQVTVLDNHDNALSFSGDVALDERRVSGVQFYVTADDFKVLDNKLGNLRVQSRLEVAGDLRAPRVSGYFGLTTGEVNLDHVLALVAPSPYATEAAKPNTGVAEAAPVADAPPASGYAASSIDVAMSVPNDLVVKGTNLQTPGSPIGLGALVVTLGGEIRATKEPGDSLRLVGAINTVRGTYDFQGRRFEILRDGSIRFVGLEDLDPTLDLRTRRVIQGVEARVNIRGTVKHPELDLSSVPPLEPADILALIVFNQPINQLGEGQQISLANRAQALATGAIAGRLAQSIGSALNLDTFEIQTAPEDGSAAQITLGQQLGEKLFVRLQQGVGAQGTTNVVAEYELAKWLRFRTNFMQAGSTQQSQFQQAQGSGADLLFFFSY